MVTTVHGYYLDRARAALTRAGGDPDAAGPLATWAQCAAGGRGVLVGEDGALLAETMLVGSAGAVRAWYVTACEIDPGIVNLDVGLAAGDLRRSTGRGVIHVTYSDVCTSSAK